MSRSRSNWYLDQDYEKNKFSVKRQALSNSHFSHLKEKKLISAISSKQISILLELNDDMEESL